MLIKNLCDRYQLSSRKSLYSRLNALNLELAKDAQGRSYATPEQLELLDELHQHLKDGGTLNSFTPVTPVVVTTQPPLPPTESSLSATTQHNAQLTVQPLTPEFLGELMAAIAASAAEQIASKLSVSKLSPPQPPPSRGGQGGGRKRPRRDGCCQPRKCGN